MSFEQNNDDIIMYREWLQIVPFQTTFVVFTKKTCRREAPYCCGEGQDSLRRLLANTAMLDPLRNRPLRTIHFRQRFKVLPTNGAQSPAVTRGRADATTRNRPPASPFHFFSSSVTLAFSTGPSSERVQ